MELTELERLQIVRDYMQQYRRLRIKEINEGTWNPLISEHFDEGEVNGLNSVCRELDEGIAAHKANAETGGVVRNSDLRTLSPYALHVFYNWLFAAFDHTKAIHDPYTNDDYSEVDEAKQDGRLEKLDDLLDDVRVLITERESGDKYGL